MTLLHTWFLVALLALCGVVRLTPARFQADAVALGSALFLTVADPWSALLLGGVSLLVYRVAQQRSGGGAILGGVAALAAAFLVYQGLSGPLAHEEGLRVPVMLGLAYAVCRHIHFLFESLKGQTAGVTLRDYLHYQFFLPVLLSGPIHRIHEFQRQALRRRLDAGQTRQGLERALYGYVKVLFVGGYLVNMHLTNRIDLLALDSGWDSWLRSARDWLSLYAQFSGYSDIAIGFALALGYRIEENFNYPLKARNLVDFWQRWHITLSSWCKDYVFIPVAAATRSRFVAILAAMLVMGLWHEASLYYVVWGLYHALGIALCRWLIERGATLGLTRLPAPLHDGVMRIQAFGWLVSGPPVIALLTR